MGLDGPSFYDEQLVPVQFGPFAQQLVARIPANVRGPVLEIACGTGALTRPLRERLDASVELVATDLAPGMLDYAQARSLGRAGITWHVADPQPLPFDDGAFGAMACAFGFMFCPDRLAALREARRMVAPGGLLAFTVWDRIEANPHALANRIGVPEQPASEAVAEDRHSEAPPVVAPLEVASAHNGNANRGKESW